MNTSGWLVFGAIGTYILGLVSSYVSRIWQTLFLTIRIPRSKLAKIYYYLNTHKTYSFAFVESFPSQAHGALPEVETSFMFCKGIPIWLDISEKYLTAGWNSKEEILTITVFRFQKNKLFQVFSDAETVKLDKRKNIDIFINQGAYFRLLNRINRSKYDSGIYLEETIRDQLDTLIKEFDTGKRCKPGVLLYGPPGNGKTSIIRSIACKYDYNIYVPIIRPDMTNDQIVNLFADIPMDEKAVIILEDFDNWFCNRYPENKDAKYSFDVFLNILDGLYINLDNKIVFITANNIWRIDKALKNRPSRIDFVLNIDNPKYETRRKILSGYDLPQQDIDTICGITDGKSAAIISEIGKRRPSSENLQESVKLIVDSFIEESDIPAVTLIKEIPDPVAQGIFTSFGTVYNNSE